MRFSSILERFRATIQRSFPLQLLFALVAVMLAVLVRVLLNAQSDEGVIWNGTFHLAVVVAAWAAGFHAAWFTIGLVGFGKIFLLRIGIADAGNMAEFALFVLISAVFIWLIEHLQMALRQSQRRAQALQLAEQRLETTLADADRERRRLQTILRSLPLSVFIVDHEGWLIAASDYTDQVWRRPNKQPPQRIEDYDVRQGWWSDTGQPLQPDDWALGKALREGITSFNEVIDVERYDGRRGAILNSAAPIVDADGKIIGGVVAVVDITPQREAERALREGEARYRAVWDASFDAKLLHNADRVLDVNQSFIDVFGYSREEVIGANAKGFLDRPDIHEALFGHTGSGAQAMFELLMQRKDGTALLVAVRARALTIGGEPLRLVAFNDISAQREASERALALELEKTRLRMITSLIQNISHDFRTPLSTINTSAYLLERLTDPERRHEKAALIGDQVNHLVKLIERMLMMTRINSDLPLERHPVDAALIVQSVHTRLMTQAQHKKLTLHLAIDEPLPTLDGDEGQLEALISELTLNAIHNTPEGGSIRLCARAEDEQTVIEVVDTGIGIDAEEQQRIFEAFYRVDPARGTDTGGIGLGLAIAHKIVELHNGRIEVESIPGQGSTFRVRLPLPLPALPSPG